MLAGQRVDSVRARALQGQGPAAEGVKGEISWSGPGRNVRYFLPQHLVSRLYRSAEAARLRAVVAESRFGKFRKHSPRQT